MDKKINRKLIKVYNILYESSGPLHWWPADSKFEVIVGAILTQFVSWRNVTTAINRLKSEGILSIDGICNANNEYLEDIVRCTRFYKQKAKKLKVFCCYVRDNYKGSLDSLFDRDMYDLRDELLSLYGIGKETADSILLYAAEKPIFVVDAYTRRIFSRLGFFKENISYENMQKFFMDNLAHDIKLFNEYHAQIDRIGNHYCSDKKPLCGKCPLSVICNSNFYG